MEEKNIGYKAMNSDMTCYGGWIGTSFQYEIGKSYEIEGDLEICNNGFHFCKNIFDTLEYYPNIEFDKRYFKIQYDQCIDDDDKSVTNKITIIEEVNILDFINESMTNNDWFNVSGNLKLPESLIRQYKDYVDWDNISHYQRLSENFIREFKDNVHWFNISLFQTLSEDFIREFKDNVHWDIISKYQVLSENFIIEFYYRISG